ncbi:MAG: PilW family protein [Acidiferrobacter sp.]
MSLSKINKGFTLVELMVAMTIGALLVLAAMVLYIPVSRSLVDQGVVGQQTLSEAVNYDFDVMNMANAGYGIQTPQTNTDVVLVSGSGPGGNATVAIPTNGTAQGNGMFWDWLSPVTAGTVRCAGLQVVAGANGNSGNDRLVYFLEAAGGSCTPAAMNTKTNWDMVTIVPSVAVSNIAPVTVSAPQDCDVRGGQFSSPVQHPLVRLQLPVATTLTGGFFAHGTDLAPTTVCLRNLPP